MSERTKYEIEAAQEDLVEFVKNFNNLKENIISIDSITEESRESLEKAADELNKVSESIIAQVNALKEEAEAKDDNDKLLTKEDINMPSPKQGETFEAWMTACMWDTNARILYPDDQSRFKACMLQGKGSEFRDS